MLKYKMWSTISSLLYIFVGLLTGVQVRAKDHSSLIYIV